MPLPDPQDSPADRGGFTRRAIERVAANAPFSDVPGPFRRRLDTSLGDQATPTQERAMRAFWWDGFWAAVPEAILVSYLGLYIVALGGSTSQVGLLLAASSACAALAFFPGARFIERFGHRKLTVLVSGGGLSRLAILGLAAVPFITDGPSAIWLVLALMCVQGFAGYFSVPAWTSLTADIVPPAIRGRFFASRNFGMSLAALATAPIAGFLLDRYSGLGGWQIVWVIAVAAGGLSTWAYARIPDVAPHADVRADQSGPGFLREVLADRNFICFLAGTALWNVALHGAGPFFNIYLAENLDASRLWIGVLSALPAITGLGGLLYFGRAMDARGTKWVMVFAGIIIPTLPAAWLFVDAPWHVIFLNTYGGIVWAGYNLAALNMLLLISPKDRRPRYAAAYQTVVFAAAFSGPLIGGQMIHHLGFKAVFVFSAVGRFLGTIFVARFVKEPAPQSV